jgi:hypothetical protein
MEKVNVLNAKNKLLMTAITYYFIIAWFHMTPQSNVNQIKSNARNRKSRLVTTGSSGKIEGLVNF